ncbi:hypothetical protein SPECIALG_96 [Erwinia phage vB_EamM_Special G]|uniref:Uncharacterized protein n=1 Tax=Erwinia phage vB_EamM_Special G TaxID=1815989 RepID=A0A191ZBY8_9CAUD|nr:hypothetical protein FDI00_gp096 [Erwinia phage vB_EamM_Special G]ANJ64906.1 hypothetical protein SPECIALG_96 [Erwinia phage vB_EamM_Special G]
MANKSVIGVIKYSRVDNKDTWTVYQHGKHVELFQKAFQHPIEAFKLRDISKVGRSEVSHDSGHYPIVDNPSIRVFYEDGSIGVGAGALINIMLQQYQLTE